MPRFLTTTDYKIMPWKNGRGFTTELLRLALPDSQTDFLFRLSMAPVETDGPFSLFPHIDRTLILLEGHGMILDFQHRRVTLDRRLFPLHFKGEEKITASLIQGSLLDFNIMVDRRWGKAEVSLEKGHTVIEALNDYIFIFDPQDKSLIELQKGERLELNSNHDLITVRVQKH